MAPTKQDTKKTEEVKEEIKEQQPDTQEKSNSESQQNKKNAPAFTLVGGASFSSMGVKFIKGAPVPVKDNKLAERLRKSKLFKEE